MSRLLKLFYIFAKIGLFTIGGGYAMIPLITEEITGNGWLTLEGVIDIIAISEMTPGPFAINAATFIGIRTAGIAGAVLATTGVVTPSFIIVMIVARYFTRFKDHPIIQGLLKGLRPAVIGLIATATFSIAKKSFLVEGAGSILRSVDLKSVIIFGLALAGIIKFKVHPALMIVISACLGILLYIW